MSYGYGLGWGIFGIIFMVLWWVIVIVAIVLFIRFIGRSSRGGSWHEKSPLEILKERYVKGEITREEFQEIKKELEK